MRTTLEGHWKTSAELLEDFPIVIFDSAGIRKFFNDGSKYELAQANIVAAELERVIHKLPNLFERNDIFWNKLLRKKYSV